MKLLILGATILGTDILGEIVENEREFVVPMVDGTGQVWQKTLGEMFVVQIPPSRIPANFSKTTYEYRTGELVKKPPTADELKAARDARKADVAAKRYEVETAGVSVAGAVVRTDRESQAMVTGAKSYSDVNPEKLIDWKTAGGWVKIDRATLIGIAQAVGNHVQACFSAERAHHEAIDALADLATIVEYDITTGWPT